MATRAERYEELAADRVTQANDAIRGGASFNDILVDRHLDRAAEMLSRINTR